VFVVIEGPDGVGKTSTQKLVAEYLTNMGYVCRSFREPGGMPFGDAMREIIFEYENLLPLTQLLAFSASRNELIQRLKMEDHPRHIFLFDRYTLSSFVYQQAAYEQNRTLTDMLFEHTFPKPDLTLILTASIQTMLKRSLTKDVTNHFDVVTPGEISLLEKRRNLYHEYGRTNANTYIIDTECALAEVSTKVVNHIVQRYAETNGL